MDRWATLVSDPIIWRDIVDLLTDGDRTQQAE